MRLTVIFIAFDCNFYCGWLQFLLRLTAISIAVNCNLYCGWLQVLLRLTVISIAVECNINCGCNCDYSICAVALTSQIKKKDWNGEKSTPASFYSNDNSDKILTHFDLLHHLDQYYQLIIRYVLSRAGYFA
jgi:hypothetical protein